MRRGIYRMGLALLGLVVIGCESGIAWREAEYRRMVLESLPDRESVNQADRPTSQPASQPASPVLGESPTLEDYLVYAAMNNPGLEAQFARWKAALERMPQERSLPDPQFTFRYFIVRMEAGPDMEQRQGASFSQMFPWWRKLELRGGRAADEARDEREKFEAAKLKLFYRVHEAYYEYYYLSRSIQSTRDIRRLLENLEAVARARYRTAAASHPDVIRAQIELARVDNELRTMEEMRPALAAKLNAAMNRPVHQDVPWPKEPAVRQLAWSHEELLARLDKENPELKSMDAMIARENKGIDLARQEYYPDVMLGVEWMDMTMMPGERGSGEDGWAVMATINVPIWWHKYAAGVREAKARRHAAVRDRTEQANSLRSQLQMALYELNKQQRSMDLYRDTLLPKSREAVRAGEAAYRGGTMSFTDLLETVRVHLEFDLARQKAVADHATKLAEVEMLVGQRLPRK